MEDPNATPKVEAKMRMKVLDVRSRRTGSQQNRTQVEQIAQQQRHRKVPSGVPAAAMYAASGDINYAFPQVPGSQETPLK